MGTFLVPLKRAPFNKIVLTSKTSTMIMSEVSWPPPIGEIEAFNRIDKMFEKSYNVVYGTFQITRIGN